MMHRGKHRVNLRDRNKFPNYYWEKHTLNKRMVNPVYRFMAFIANYFYLPAKGLAPISPIQMELFSRRTCLGIYTSAATFITGFSIVLMAYTWSVTKNL